MMLTNKPPIEIIETVALKRLQNPKLDNIHPRILKECAITNCTFSEVIFNGRSHQRCFTYLQEWPKIPRFKL